MQLQTIDKALYQRRYKRVAITLALSLAVLGLSFSTLLIAIMGNSINNTALNAAGVLLAVAVLISALQHLKVKPYFVEVAYVWSLKQELNQITRRLRHVKTAAESGNRNAMVILSFSYAGSKQLWQLDDNTLIMDELQGWQAQLAEQQQRYGIAEVSETEYRRELLKAF